MGEHGAQTTGGSEPPRRFAASAHGLDSADPFEECDQRRRGAEADGAQGEGVEHASGPSEPCARQPRGHSRAQATKGPAEGRLSGAEAHPQRCEREEDEPVVRLSQRALPLIELLEAAVKDECDVMWDR